MSSRFWIQAAREREEEAEEKERNEKRNHIFKMMMRGREKKKRW